MLDSTINNYRKKAGLTQKKLAEILNIPRTTMSFYETKRQYPDLRTAEKMAEILGATIGQLYDPVELQIIFKK